MAVAGLEGVRAGGDADGGVGEVDAEAEAGHGELIGERNGGGEGEGRHGAGLGMRLGVVGFCFCAAFVGGLEGGGEGFVVGVEVTVANG